MENDEIRARLVAATKYLERLSDPSRQGGSDDSYVVSIASNRSEAQDAGLGDSAEAQALDEQLVRHAQALMDIMGGSFAFYEDDPRRQTVGDRPAYPANHWWWYLDEMLLGTREWPEGVRR